MVEDMIESRIGRCRKRYKLTKSLIPAMCNKKLHVDEFELWTLLTVLRHYVCI